MNSAISITFAYPISSASVTTNTLFVVPISSTASLSSQKSYNPTSCNADNSIASTITQETINIYKIRIKTDVTDVAGNALASTYTTATGFTTVVPDQKKMFVTDSRFGSGKAATSFGEVAGADGIFMADANRPDASKYKALLAGGSTRVACTTIDCIGGPGEHTARVLAANTEYYQSDGDENKFFQTNANGVLVFTGGH